jgi:hypothetical protein
MQGASVHNQILAFQKQFTQAIECFKVCRILNTNVLHFV